MNRLYWLDVVIDGISEAEAWRISDILGNLAFRWHEGHAEFEGDTMLEPTCAAVVANQVSADIYRVTGRFVRAAVNVSDMTFAAHLDSVETHHYHPELADYEALSSLIAVGFM